MSLYRVGGETRVNATVANSQGEPRIAGLPDGGWVATWSSYTGDGTLYDVLQQRFDRNGSPASAVDRVTNGTIAGMQFDPQVSALADGGWVIVWTSPDQDSDGIYVQRYDRDGNAAFAADRPVNVVALGSQTRAAVTGLADGGWVVTWESAGQDGDGRGIYQQRFDRNGAPLSDADRLVNATSDGDQSQPSVSALSDGGWVIAWQAMDPGGTAANIYQQRFDASGRSTFAADRPVNATLGGDQSEPNVAGLSDGGWIVTWTSLGQDGEGAGVYQQKFNRDGAATAERRVNATTAGEQFASTVAALPEGGWVVTWTSNGQDGSFTGIYQQHFDRDGQARSPGDLLVNTTTRNDQLESSVTALPDGGWVVTWKSYAEASGYDIVQQRFLPSRAPTGVTLAGPAIREAAAAGSTVGTLFAPDPNVGLGDSLTYELLDDAGGRFDLQGSRLTVENPLLLDYEQARSHLVTVRVTDRDNLSITRSVAVQLDDVSRERVMGGAGADRLVGGRDKDVFDGWRGHDALMGGGGNDTLTGGSGNDKLHGGTGLDRLAGSRGRDVFVFDTKANGKTNADRIVDFRPVDDSIHLDDAVFAGLGRKGSPTKPAKLEASKFWIGSSAHDKNDRIVYDKATGALLYDPDGIGGRAAIRVATLESGLSLSERDFFVI